MLLCIRNTMHIQSMKTRICHEWRPAVKERLQAVVMPSVLLLASALFFTGCAHTQSADTVSTLSRPAGRAQGTRYSQPAAPASRRLPATAGSSYTATSDKANVVDIARSAIGARYKFGGTSPETGLDCSGLVCWVYEQVGVSVPRQAKEQLLYGLPVGRSSLKPGDIVVFKSPRSRSGWHSGIYSGNGMFVHSPSAGKSVTESSMHEDYYANRFMGATRLIAENGRPLAGIGNAARRQVAVQSKAVTVASSPVAKAKASVAKTPAKVEKVASVTKKSAGATLKKSDKKQTVANAKSTGKRVVSTSSKGSAQKNLLKASVNQKARHSSVGQSQKTTVASAKKTASKSSAGKASSASNAKQQNKNSSTGKRTLLVNKSGKQTAKRGS